MSAFSSRERTERRPRRGGAHARDDVHQRRQVALNGARASLAELGIRPFHVEFKRLLRIVGAEDFSGANAAQALTRAQLADAIGRLATLSTEGGPKSAYAAVHLGDYIRGLVQDARGYGDNSAMIERVLSDCLEPGLRALATDIVASASRTRSNLNRHLDRKGASRADHEMREFQQELTALFAQARVRLNESLTRVLNDPASGQRR